jgi:hypothetical protein
MTTEREDQTGLNRTANRLSPIPELGHNEELVNEGRQHTTDTDGTSEMTHSGEQNINDTRCNYDDEPLDPHERRINGMTYAQCMDSHQAMICALGTGLDGRAERSELRKAMMSLHSLYFPADFSKSPLLVQQKLSPSRTVMKRARDHEVNQSVSGSFPASKKKKLSSAARPCSALVTEQTHSGTGNSHTPMHLPKQKIHSTAKHNTARLYPRETVYVSRNAHLHTPPPTIKRRVASKNCGKFPTSGRRPAHTPQTFLSTSSSPSHSTAKNATLDPQNRSTASSIMSGPLFRQQSPCLSSSSTTSSDVDNYCKAHEEGDEDEDVYEERRPKKQSPTHRRPLSNQTSSSSGSMGPRKVSSQGASNKKNGSWSDKEYKALWRLLVARRELEAKDEDLTVLKDERLMVHMSMQLAEEGIFRSKNACKNFWNRYGREWSKFEERVGGFTNRCLTTSAQSKKKA